MNKRIISMLLVAALAGACTPDAYQRSADLDVRKLLKDHEKRTLGYVPEVEAPVETPAAVTRKSYQKLPATPIPPDLPPAMERAEGFLTYGPLGPEMLYGRGMTSPQHQALTIGEARQSMIDRLTLGPPAARKRVLALDLFSSIGYAVQHSRDYQSRMEDLYLSALDVTLQRHLFTPRPFARTGVEYTGGQLDVGYRSALNITSSAGIRQQLPYGGEIVAQGLFDFVNALNDNVSDGESAQLALNGSIPLLRGAGMINLEGLINSERSMVYQVRSFEDFRRSFVVNIASQYFRLLTLQQAITNRRITYISAAQLTERSYALYAAGRPGFNFQSVQRAQQQQFQAENNIIRAVDAYQSGLDVFKIQLGMPVNQDLDIVQVALDVAPPDLETDAVALALQYRLDMRTAEDRVEDSRRSVANARNGLLPDLDFTARGAIGNRADTPGADIDSRTLEYSAGLSLDLPVDRLSERNAYRRSLISLERARRSLDQTRDQIIGQVRDDLRAIRSAQATLEIQQRNIDLAQKRLDYANELLVLGRASDSRDSVDAQNDLLSAQDSYDSARATYQIQVMQFLRDTGTLRINPDAGSLGLVMDRARPQAAVE